MTVRDIRPLKSRDPLKELLCRHHTLVFPRTQEGDRNGNANPGKSSSIFQTEQVPGTVAKMTTEQAVHTVLGAVDAVPKGYDYHCAAVSA